MPEPTGTDLTTREDAAPAEANGAAMPAHADGDMQRYMLAAIERGDVELVERMMDLQERVDARNARAAFFEALTAVQSKVTEVPKTRTAKIATRKGGSYSYSYAPLETITRTIRPVLKEHGLSYSFTTEPGGDGVLNVVCILRHVEGHEERATFPVPTATDAAMSAAQKNGAALTYGRRQSLVAVLGLTAADDDVDGADVGRSAETITEKQAANIESMLDELTAKNATARFVRFMGVERVADIPAAEYDRAVKKLEEARGSG